MSSASATALIANGVMVDNPSKKFYRTEDDSDCSKCLRTLRCGCFDPKYDINVESVKIEEWRDCTLQNDSVDVDDIRDMSMTQTCGPGLYYAGQGHIKLYVTEKVDGVNKDRTVLLRHVENARKVFDTFASHVYKVNNLKLGMKRPDLKDMPFLIYDSDADPSMLKCGRAILCCGCCCFPHTVITKERISTTFWTSTCQKQTLQFDLDHIENVTLKRGCVASCFCNAGDIDVSGKDQDQNGIKMTWVYNSKHVFSKLDDYCNVLNNRNRVLGDQGMHR
eukprot:c1543_g1_i1.p1 GENE.c1543_g1_i1~~c1543_g1_i1.p1  ORF type:complete len:278 (+),score=40.09 c1543_g1_i1:839-1672(+)